MEKLQRDLEINFLIFQFFAFFIKPQCFVQRGQSDLFRHEITGVIHCNAPSWQGGDIMAAGVQTRPPQTRSLRLGPVQITVYCGQTHLPRFFG